MWRLMQQAVTALGVGALSLAAGPASASDCVAWSAAGAIIAKHSLVPPHIVFNHIKSKKLGQIIRVSLCTQRHRFFYKLVVLGAGGTVQTVTVDARTGR